MFIRINVQLVLLHVLHVLHVIITLSLTHTETNKHMTHRMEIYHFQHTGICCVMMTSFSHILICHLHSYHTSIKETGTKKQKEE